MAPVVDARAEEQGPARPPAPPPKRRRSGSKAQQLAPGQATLDNFLLRPPEPQLPQPAEEAAEEGQGEEPQLQQAPEGQAAAGDSAGAGAMEKGRGTKRGRRSEAERLQPFSWDQRREEHPFNEAQIKPRTRRRQKNRGLQGAAAGESSTSGEEPGDAAAEDAGAAGPELGQSRSQQEEEAAEMQCQEEEGEEEMNQQQQQQQQQQQPPPTGCKQPMRGKRQVRRASPRSEDEAAAGEQQQQQQQQQQQPGEPLDAAEPPAPAALQLLEQPPPCSATAALGFAAAWYAVRGFVQARTAATLARDRLEALQHLLAPLAAAGAEEAAAVREYETVFTTVLLPSQQEQHLVQLAEATDQYHALLAARPPGSLPPYSPGVRARVEGTLELLKVEWRPGA